MAGAPVIPVGLWGTNLRWPRSGLKLSAPLRPVVAVVFGEPIRVEGDPKCRPDVQSLTDRIMGDIDSLVVKARRRAAGPGLRLGHRKVRSADPSS